MALPKFLQPCLPSYNLLKMKPFDKNDKRIIVTAVLNYGNFKSLKWLTTNYPQREIKKVVKNPDRGVWLKEVLAYWQKILNLKIDKAKFNQAIINLNPPKDEKDFPRGFK